MGDPVIRAMTADDSVAVADLCDQLGYPVDPERLAQRFAEVTGQGHSALLVAAVNGRVVGWIHVAVTPLLEADLGAEILGLVVDHDHRSAGVGAALLRAGEEWARVAGCVAMRVRSRIARERAHAFYERSGYARIKKQHAFEKSWS
jgi:GNAT superfamily N-acetyltransferase